MPDREKVIKGLECCVAYDYKCNDCPYQDDGGAEDGCYSDELKADAIALLKAQEPRVMTDTELEAIRKAPLILKPNVDAAPVVRCRDCKHYNTNGCADGFGWCERNGDGHGSTDDWFCADGERRYDDAAD